MHDHYTAFNHMDTAECRLKQAQRLAANYLPRTWPDLVVPILNEAQDHISQAITKAPDTGTRQAARSIQKRINTALYRVQA